MSDPLRPEIPVRPVMPINGRSKVQWGIKYGRELSDYFRFTRGHYPDDAEWAAFLDLQYAFQSIRDAQLAMESET